MKLNLLCASLLLAGASQLQAQIEFNKNYPNLGFTGAELLESGDYRFLMNFNYNLDGAKAFGNVGTNGKGIFGRVFNDQNKKVDFYKNRKTENWGANSNVFYAPDINYVLENSVAEEKQVWLADHEYWKQGHLFLDLAEGDQVFAVYPGIYKKVNLGFQVKTEGAGMVSDISFDILTLNTGNAGNVTYKLIVCLGADYPASTNEASATILEELTNANASTFRNNLWVVDDIFTTDASQVGPTSRKTINLAEALGIDQALLNGQKIYVQLYTSGTATAIKPGVFDPVIGLDNIQGIYRTTNWELPTGAVANADLQHNEGDAVEVPVNVETPIKIRLKDTGRTSKIEVKGSTLTNNPFFYFAAEGAVKALDNDGHYTIDVPYTYTAPTADAPFVLTIAAPQNGALVNDDFELHLTTKVRTVGSRPSEKLEITNGVRFWYTVNALGVEATSIESNELKAANISVQNGVVFVKNNSEAVSVANLNGVTLMNISASEAEAGFELHKGIYLVITGNKSTKISVN